MILLSPIPDFIITVLIDTWWNVNIRETDTIYRRTDGFNRYMVECEYELLLQDMEFVGF